MMNKTSKDVSGITPQERHKIIVNYLKEINKPSKVFHLRWKPGDLLTGKVLESTPMFWYMKYKWSRTEIETMFWNARCVIGPLFDQALQQTYGGSPGPRWRGAIPERQKSSWRERQADKLTGWRAEQTDKITEHEKKERQQKLEMEKKKEMERKLHEEEEKTLTYKSNDIWNAVSDFGADKCIDYTIFSDNLKDRGINVSPLLAKQLFDQLSGSGNLSRQEMEELIKNLDKMNESVTVTWDMLSDKLGCMAIMKRVLLAAGTGEPFNVDDFIFASSFGVSISPIQFLNKLSDRDVPWDDRVRAMEQLGANVGTNPLFNNVLAKGNIPELLCGWATQTLDNKPEVQKTAIDTLPNIFHTAMEFGNKDIAVGYLEEVLDNLFKVLDDTYSRRNHPAAKDAISKIIDDILNIGDPESVLVVSHILAEKCDHENANNPQTREAALNELQKIMFGTKSPYLKSDEMHNLPSKATVHREWLDIATNKQSAPSPVYMSQKTNKQRVKKNVAVDPNIASPAANSLHGHIPSDEYDEHEKNIQNPNKKHSYTHDPDKKQRRKGKKTDIMLKYTNNEPNDLIPPWISSDPPSSCNASKSIQNPEPTQSFLCDFGGKNRAHLTQKVTKPNNLYRVYPSSWPGTYPASMNATGKYNTINPKLQSQTADVTIATPSKSQEKQRSNALIPPIIRHFPPTSTPKKPIKFTVEKSIDANGDPCNKFIWDFGDGTPLIESDSPQIYHTFDKPGIYSVHVTAINKDGDKIMSSIQQHVIDPNQKLQKQLAPTNKPIAKYTVNGTDPASNTSVSIQQSTTHPLVFDNDTIRGSPGPKSKNYGGPKIKGIKSPSKATGKFIPKRDNKKPSLNDNNVSEEKSQSMNLLPDEIGDEFRNIVHDAVSKGIMDPNEKNQETATNLIHFMAQINPIFLDGLNDDAKERYRDWKLKPLGKYPESSDKYAFKRGKQEVHKVKCEVVFDANPSFIPDV